LIKTFENTLNWSSRYYSFKYLVLKRKAVPISMKIILFNKNANRIGPRQATNILVLLF